MDTATKERLRRDEFPVTRNLVYMNHAAVGALPLRTFNAMESHARDQLEFGAAHWKTWFGEVVRLRADAARFLGADPGEISIIKNTSEGMSFVAGGTRWREGDNAITTDMEFPSNYTPWKALERRGVECRTIRNRDGVFDLDDIDALIDPRTRIVALSAVSFHNGFTPDLEAVGRLCAERGVRFCVDASQAAGMKPIDVRRANISFLATAGQKWLLGPEGVALFYCAADARDELDVIEHGWTNVARGFSFFQEDFELLPDGRRFEAGSLNTNGVYALRASISLLEEIGMREVEAEVLRISGRLADRLESIGCDVRTPRPVRSGIVGVVPPGPPEANRIRDLHKALDREGIICTPREGMLRFAPHFYNDDDEIDRVVEALGRLAHS